MLGGVVYLTVLCYHPYLVSMLFADLLPLHLVTFLMFLFFINDRSGISLCHYGNGRVLY